LRRNARFFGEMTLRQVSTGDLSVGMYVARLDRPWLETPFLFQGFRIKTAQEIEELARYCRAVFVDESVNAGAAPGPAPSGGNGAGATAERQPGSFYKDLVPVVREAPLAREAHETASSTYAATMETVRCGGRLDLQTLQSVVTPMMESVLRNQDAITWLARIRAADDYTYGHSVTCSVYAIAFGRHLGLPKDELQVLGLGALLFDVGKTRIPKDLLNKTGPLTDEEHAIMRGHVEHGVAIVRETAGVDERVIAMVRSHHERYDGSGYPDGLMGPDIPVYARIAGVVDFYSALTSSRPYAPARSSYDAMRELHRRSRGEFQTEMVDNFVQAIGMFPNGALVELSTGEIGIVIEQNRVRRLRPKVLIVLDDARLPLERLRSVDLRELPSEPGTSGAVWIERGLEPGAFGIDPADYYL
jgi:putative nucleotidyltransferase with HDIG domain